MPPSLAQCLRSDRNLWRAWRHVQQSARHSQSDATKAAVRAFGERASAGIRSIYRRLNRGTFEFSVPKAVAVEREGQDPRPILVAPVDERVVQRALLQVLKRTPVGELVEGASSFGAIPNRGVRSAIQVVVQAIGSGATYYVRSDIGGFFQYIPRPRIIERIGELLPDDSIQELLVSATEVDRDLLKGHNVATYRHLFPTPEVGMAQGGALSAFFGNVAMEEFDALMSGEGIITVRYVDDFIVLGPSAKVVEDRFLEGEVYLRTMGMDIYPPDGPDHSKAARGVTKKLFNFLGCEVSSSFVRPDRRSRDRIFQKVKRWLDASLEDLRAGNVEKGKCPDSSITSTLYYVHNMLRSWSASYSFCNADQLLASLDRRIDREIQRFLGEAGRIRKACKTAAKSRRVLGVYPLLDGREDPLYGTD